MADKYKKQGKSLWDRLEELYHQYGCYESVTKTQNFDLADAERYMQDLREKVRKNEVLEEFGGKILKHKDYIEGSGELPKANVLKVWFADDSSLIVRPSGTEPRIKFYREFLR